MSVYKQLRRQLPFCISTCTRMPLLCLHAITSKSSLQAFSIFDINHDKSGQDLPGFSITMSVFWSGEAWRQDYECLQTVQEVAPFLYQYMYQDVTGMPMCNLQCQCSGAGKLGDKTMSVYKQLRRQLPFCISTCTRMPLLCLHAITSKSSLQAFSIFDINHDKSGQDLPGFSITMSVFWSGEAWRQDYECLQTVQEVAPFLYQYMYQDVL